MSGIDHHPLQAESLDHVVLRVRDPAAMIAFYTEVLGCGLDWHRPDLGLTHLRVGSSLVDLLDVAGPLGGDDPATAGRVDHFCLLLRDFDEARIRAHLAAHGVEAGPAAPRYGAVGMGPSLYLRDPEGNVVELKGREPVGTP